MRKILIIPMLLLSLTLGATKYYVAPSTATPAGSDLNAGIITAPFLTLEKAWTAVAAGDTVYMRGGTYTHAMLGETSLSGKSGTSGNTINIWAYPSESPVINLSDFTPTTWATALLITGDYIHVKGIRITGLTQPIDGDYISKGFSLGNGSDYCTIERVEVDHIGGQGFTQESPSALTNITFLNCDSHHNSDPYSDLWGAAYGAGDGFVYGGKNNNLITFTNCRSWSNSDDGWDVRNSNANIFFNGCWSFRNGYRADGTTTGGDGLGFKTGGKAGTGDTTVYLRVLYNCVAFQNRVHGFDPQPDDVNSFFPSRYYHCVAYDNKNTGFNANWYTQIDMFRNCVAYSNDLDDFNPSVYTNDTINSWNGFTVTDADFVSIDTTGVDGARQADGSLPDLDFLNLVVGSDLKDAGWQVGVTEDVEGTPRGYLPDIGAYEYEDIRLLLLNNKLTIVNDTVRTIRK